MKTFVCVGFSLLGVLMIACQPVEQPADNSMLKPGDEIDGMIVTTGTYNSPPLWAFCSPAWEEGGATSVDCQVPPLPRLAIGHTLGMADPVLQTLDWSALHWEFSLDGQGIDLKTFGIYNFVVPDLAPSPSPIREVFRQLKAWDVVLLNPTPGAHTLSGLAYDEGGTYVWTANFTVEASHTQ